MNVSGIRAAKPGTVEFIETMEKKAARSKVTDYDEKAFDRIGPNAPQFEDPERIPVETGAYSSMGKNKSFICSQKVNPVEVYAICRIFIRF